MHMHKMIPAILSLFLTALTIGGCGDNDSSPLIAGSAVEIKNVALPVATNGASYTTILGASGGTAPYKWSIETGKLPTGLFLIEDGSEAGNIKGAPTALGTFTMVFKVTDSSILPKVTQKALQINVSNLAFTPGSSGAALYNDHCAYCHKRLGATDQQHKDATLAQIKAAIAADTGGMGEFGTGGVFPLSDADLNAILVAIAAPAAYIAPTFTITSLPAATVGVAYSQTLTAKDGSLPYVWNTMGGDAIPAGLSLNPATGVLSGMPTIAGIANVMFMLEDAKAGTMVHQSITITVNAVAAAPDGIALFAGKCAGCHGGSLAAYNHKGSSAVIIQTAIDSKISSMNTVALKALTPAEVTAIASAVK